MLAIVAVTALGVSNGAHDARLAVRAQTAADALALAAVLEADLDDVARRHGVESYEVSYDIGSATVNVVRDGRRARAIAIDHRHDINDDE